MSNSHRSVIPGYTGFRPSMDIRSTLPYVAQEKGLNHIPGYKGYVAGVKAENVYAKSFGRSSS